jgi:hypothetical protein
MLMKIVTAVLTVLLIATLGVAAMFYLNTYKPMDADYARMKAGLPELDKAKTELKKLKEKESNQTAWMKPVIDALSAGLSDEIKSGKAEVLAADSKVVVNIAEQALYLPGTYTFAQESPQLRSNLATLLKEKMQDKDIYIGNSTQSVPPQVKRRKKVPGKDARTLAAERSAALIKDLEKNGVNQDKLIAAAYSAKEPELGIQIKGHKTIIIIENTPMVPAGATKQEATPAPQTSAKTALDTKNTATAPATSSSPLPKPIPILPAQPKAQ